MWIRVGSMVRSIVGDTNRILGGGVVERILTTGSVVGNRSETTGARRTQYLN